MTAPPDPGLYEMSMEDYHQLPGANVSRLKMMRDKSPAHVLWERAHPTPQTEAQLIGSLAHEAVLQPSLFASRYIRGPEGDGRKKDVREAWAQLESEQPDMAILKPGHFDQAMSMRRAVEGHRIACRLLEGQAEQSAIWKDPETGVLCKGRFDLLSSRTPTIVDLKSTKDASAENFARDIWNYRWHMQGAHYLTGAQELGFVAEHFIIVAVEKAPPHCIAVFDLEADVLALAAEQLQPLYRMWAKCEAEGIWPGYPEKVVPIGVPEWAFRKMEKEVA